MSPDSIHNILIVFFIIIKKTFNGLHDTYNEILIQTLYIQLSKLHGFQWKKIGNVYT